MSHCRLLLVGNPNVGKSALFNALTGGRAAVSNYPGTTVEVSRGRLAGTPDGYVMDTPGVRSLVPSSDDEAVSRRALQEAGGDAVVVQVADMKQLRRGLLVTLQLGQLAIPTVLALNMADEAKAAGLAVDLEGLSEALGIPVVATVATKGVGVARLLEATRSARAPRNHLALPAHAASFAQSILVGGQRAGASDAHAALAYHRSMQEQADALAERFLQKTPHLTPGRAAERLARLTTHPVLGWPLLALVLFVVYEVVGVFGAGTLVDLIEDGLFGQLVNPWFVALFAHVPFAPAREFFVGPYGLLTVGLTYGLAIVFPIVLTFFFVFALLEDSGYLPRLAVMSDRFMRLMGLNGRAVLPMVLGLGCDTMATLTTRTLPTRKERILTTLLLALAIPCSAQLGVILGMLSTLPARAVMAWLGTLLLVMLGVGRLASHLIPGERSAFVVELPPLRWPRPANLLLKTVSRLEWYLKEALPLFLVGTALLFALDRVGILQALTRIGEPLVTGVLGLPATASEAFLIGFLRRDFAATRLFDMSRTRMLDDVQTLVAMVTITLFIPCIANVFIIAKEHGKRTAAAVVAFVFPFAFAVGGIVRLLARAASW